MRADDEDDDEDDEDEDDVMRMMMRMMMIAPTLAQHLARSTAQFQHFLQGRASRVRVPTEGRKRRANGLCVNIVFEVFGSAAALDGLARAAGAAEVGGGERVDSG